MTACFLSNISAKYYKNPSMLSRVIAKNVGDVFLRHSVNTIIPVFWLFCAFFSGQSNLSLFAITQRLHTWFFSGLPAHVVRLNV